jgi:N-acyl-D-amino-acid deacylase
VIKKVICLSLLTIYALFVAHLSVAATDADNHFIIINAFVVDGSGAVGKLSNVRVTDGIITEIGDIRSVDTDNVIDAGGLVLAPGFIDTHSHHDWGLIDKPHADAVVSQGVTTIIVGQDGGSDKPIAELKAALKTTPVAVNIGTYTGHGTIRAAVMGTDFKRVATEEEIKAMKELLVHELENGSLGLSTGLEYDPGIYSTTEEIIALAKKVAEYKGRYISHMRSEDRALKAAIDELIHIGREADLQVQVSHIKLASVELWGQADEIIKKLDKARAEGIDVTADIYPYTFWESTLTVLLPDRDFYDKEAATFALEKLAPADGLTLTYYAPDQTLVGKTVAEIAKMRGDGEVDTYLELIRTAYAGINPDDEEAGRRESVMGESMSEEDIQTLIAWPHANICSDGAFEGHPRGHGAFARALHQYVVEGEVLSLEEMIRKMTSLSAAHIGIKDRGLIAKGYKADLVLFDPDKVKDNATIEDPDALSDGINQVWVNGISVWHRSQPSGAYPGEFIER